MDTYLGQLLRLSNGGVVAAYCGFLIPFLQWLKSKAIEKNLFQAGIHLSLTAIIDRVKYVKHSLSKKRIMEQQ